MIKKINSLLITSIKNIFLHYKKQNVSCAWCFQKQSIYANLKKDHICSYCGKTFFIKNNREFKV